MSDKTIESYKFKDADIERATIPFDGAIEIECFGDRALHIEKADAIEIAKHFYLYDAPLVERLAESESKITQLEQELERVNSWIEFDQFDNDSSYEGWVWVIYKGRVTQAYRDHEYRYRFHSGSSNVFMSECISHVMPWKRPEPPVNKGEKK